MTNYYLTQRFMYYYAGLHILINLVFFGFAIGWVVSVSQDVSVIVLCLLIYFVILGIGNTIFISYRVIHEHIHVSETGVEYHSPLSIVEIPWSSFEKIAYGWHDYLRVEGLLVDTSRLHIKKSSLFDRRTFDPFSSRKMIIPLSCLSDNWRESELGRQIKQYAPNLFL